MKSLKIGNRTFYDLPVGVFKIEDVKKSTKGNIGIKFLKNFTVTIDWPQKNIYLAQIEGRELRRNIRTFGFSYDYKDGAMRVNSIYSGSEAEKTGMKINDRILSINHHDMENLTDSQIQQFKHGKLHFSRKEDDGMTLGIMIEGKQKTISLSAYDLFQE